MTLPKTKSQQIKDLKEEVRKLGDQIARLEYLNKELEDRAPEIYLTLDHVNKLREFLEDLNEGTISVDGVELTGMTLRIRDGRMHMIPKMVAFVRWITTGGGGGGGGNVKVAGG